MMNCPSWRVFAVLLIVPKLVAFADETANELDRSRLAKRLPAAVERQVDFVSDVQPIFREHCFECHSGNVEEGELNLAIKDRALRGGEHGKVLVPGDSLSSVLVHLVSGVDDDRMMPPEGEPLSAEQVGILRTWIDHGAKWPEGTDVLDPRVERARRIGRFGDSNELIHLRSRKAILGRRPQLMSILPSSCELISWCPPILPARNR